MRTMEDGQAVRSLFKVPPVRVCLGDMASDDEVVSCFVHEDRQMRGELALFRGRDQDREWIGAHERERVGVVLDSEVFRDIHVSSFAPSGLRWNALTSPY